jgi:hypothetical protein
LPKRDGFALLRDIRALEPRDVGGLSVIAMTVFTSTRGTLTRLWRRERSNSARYQSLVQPPLSGAAKQQEDSRKNHCGLQLEMEYTGTIKFQKPGAKKSVFGL